MTKRTFAILVFTIIAILILWIWQKHEHDTRIVKKAPDLEQVLPVESIQTSSPEDLALRDAIPCIQNKDWTCAEMKLKAALSIAPQSSEIAQTLGKVYFIEDKFREAAAVFDSVQAHGPLDKYAAAMYAKAKVLAREDSDLGSVRSLHFDLGFENSKTLGKSKDLLAELERDYDAECLLWGHYPERRFTVILYESRAHQGSRSLPDWSAAAFDGRLRIPLSIFQDSTGSSRILRHELAHAFIAEMSGNTAPAWFQEGFAQKIDGTVPDVPGETPPPLNLLLHSFSTVSDAELAGALYRYSLIMAERLYAKAGNYRALGEFLQAYRETISRPGGPTFDEALAGQFGVSTANLYAPAGN